MNPISRPFDHNDAQAVYDLVASSDQPNLAIKVAQALDIIEQAILDYGPDQLALSFNGGKDCTAIVHLLAAALLRASQSNLTEMQALYIRCESPFSQVEKFVQACQARYSLQLFSFRGTLKDGLQAFISETPRKAILIGTRATDPNGASLTSFDPTDSDWPSVMRVHPILNWSYHDVWDFLRTLKVGWCELYDTGYTSLGSTYNTKPNPYLATPTTWKPAWELEDGTLERAGRSFNPPCKMSSVGSLKYSSV